MILHEDKPPTSGPAQLQKRKPYDPLLDSKTPELQEDACNLVPSVAPKRVSRSTTGRKRARLLLTEVPNQQNPSTQNSHALEREEIRLKSMVDLYERETQDKEDADALRQRRAVKAARAKLGWAHRRQEALRSPLQNPSVIQDAPVFYPTAAEFRDPVAYVLSIQHLAEPFGICKIIPPEGWAPKLKLPDNFLFKTRHQMVAKYQHRNPTASTLGFMVDDKSVTLAKYKDLAQRTYHKKFPYLSADLADQPLMELLFWRKHFGHMMVRYGSDVEGSLFSMEASKDGNEALKMQDDPHDDIGDHVKDPGPLAVPPLHPGNLRQSPCNSLRHCPNAVAGVTDPMLYIGMVFSMFCWHREDMNLYSLSFNHHGASKTWYGAPGSQANQLESAMRRNINSEVLSRFPKGLRNRIMFQKVIMFQPTDLTKHGVRLCRLQQKPGEMVLTFPGAYHAGFNEGFCCAEAVNFATWRWLEHGRRTMREYRKVGQPPCVDQELILYATVQDLLLKKVQGGDIEACLQTVKQEWNLFVTKQENEFKSLEQILALLLQPQCPEPAMPIVVQLRPMAEFGTKQPACLKCRTLCFNRVVRLSENTGPPLLLCPDCCCSVLGPPTSAAAVAANALAAAADPSNFVEVDEDEALVYEPSEGEEEQGGETPCSSEPATGPAREVLEVDVFTFHALEHLQGLQGDLDALSAQDFANAANTQSEA